MREKTYRVHWNEDKILNKKEILSSFLKGLDARREFGYFLIMKQESEYSIIRDEEGVQFSITALDQVVEKDKRISSVMIEIE